MHAVRRTPVGRLQEYGIDVLIPPTLSRELIHRVIQEELCLGKTHAESRQVFLDVIDALKQRGAEAIRGGCTEIGMLVNEQRTSARLFDTTRIHAEEAVTFALQESSV